MNIFVIHLCILLISQYLTIQRGLYHNQNMILSNREMSQIFNFSQKNFGWEKIFGYKKIFGSEKIFGSKKKFGSEKNFGSEKIFGSEKNFGLKNWGQNILIS